MLIKALTIITLLACSLGSFAQGVMVNDGVESNPDGSFTIYKPKLLRGNKEMRIYGYKEGACALFGFEKALESTYTSHNVPNAALLNEDGSFNLKKIGTALEEVTCYNVGELIPVAEAAKIEENPDGSFSIYEPRLLRGNKKLRIYGYKEGACALFGFNSVIDSVYTNHNVPNAALLDSDGKYLEGKFGTALMEVTCYDEGNHRNVGEANGVIYYHEGNFSHDILINKNLQPIQLN